MTYKKDLNSEINFFLKEMKIKQLKENLNNSDYMDKAIEDIANQILL